MCSLLTARPARALRRYGRAGTEPLAAEGRPIGMVTVKLPRMLPAALLAASLTTFAAGCGAPAPAGRPDGEGGPPGGGPSAAPSSAPANRTVYFSTRDPIAAGLHEVVHDRAELGRFADRAAAGNPPAADAITAAGTATDFSRNALVAWTETTGCSLATSAELRTDGARLSLRIDQPDPPQECLRAFSLAVVFEVPKERIPAGPVFDDPGSAG